MKRKQIPQEIRQQVYEMYDGHCAYCGCKLKYEDMQVDHKESVYVAEYGGKEADNSIDNLMPACRQCNFYKQTMSIEGLRRKLMNFQERLSKEFAIRLGQRYGMISVSKWDGKFYFEKMDKQ